jgi:hypothetical protein
LIYQRYYNQNIDSGKKSQRIYGIIVRPDAYKRKKRQLKQDHKR